MLQLYIQTLNTPSHLKSRNYRYVFILFKMLSFLQKLVVKDEVYLFVYENDKLTFLYAQFKKNMH